MSLEVIPEELPMIGAQIDATHASLHTVLGAAMVVSTPVPAGADLVSGIVAGVMSGYSPLYYAQTTVPGVAQIGPGTAALAQNAADYVSTDVSAEGTVHTSATFSTV